MKRHLLAAMISLVMLQTACSYKESSSQATISPAPADELMKQDSPKANISEMKDQLAELAPVSKVEQTAELYQVQTAKKAMMVKERAVHSSLMAGNIAMSPPVAMMDTMAMPREERDKFEHFKDNPIKQVATDPVSTFSLDLSLIHI